MKYTLTIDTETSLEYGRMSGGEEVEVNAVSTKHAISKALKMAPDLFGDYDAIEIRVLR